MAVGIIVKSYEHFNKSFPNWNTPNGVHVKSKDHYDRLMKQNNMITYEQAQQQATGPKRKDYVLSKDAKAVIEHARSVKDSKGNVKLGDKAIEKMIKMKAIGKKLPNYMQIPEKYQPKGGFINK